MVTPVGRPWTATAIVPLKPSFAVALNVTCPLAPCARLNVAGCAVSVKLPPVGVVAAVTTNETDVRAFSAPDMPCTTSVLVPIAASAAAVTVNVVAAPAATVAFAGVRVQPEGIPLTPTWTEPLNPSEPLDVTVKVFVWPCTMVTT